MWNGVWNKRKLISDISNRFLASSVSRAWDWWSGDCEFKPHWGQFLTKFILFCVTLELSDNLTEMRLKGLTWKTQLGNVCCLQICCRLFMSLSFFTWVSERSSLTYLTWWRRSFGPFVYFVFICLLFTGGLFVWGLLLVCCNNHFTSNCPLSSFLVASQSYLCGWRTVFFSLILEGGGAGKWAFTCGSYSSVEWAFTCGSYSSVEWAFTCGRYSSVEWAFTCGSYSHVEGHSCVRVTHMWKGIHIYGSYSCVEEAFTCGTRHQSEFFHTLIFYHTWWIYTAITF